MPDGLRLLQRVDKRMSDFIAGKKNVRRDAFAAELDHNIGWEASHIEPRPTDAEIEDVRVTVSSHYAAKLVNF